MTLLLFLSLAVPDDIKLFGFIKELVPEKSLFLCVTFSGVVKIIRCKELLRFYYI
jgi:hypothetical protein